MNNKVFKLMSYDIQNEMASVLSLGFDYVCFRSIPLLIKYFNMKFGNSSFFSGAIFDRINNKIEHFSMIDNLKLENICKIVEDNKICLFIDSNSYSHKLSIINEDELKGE